MGVIFTLILSFYCLLLLASLHIWYKAVNAEVMDEDKKSGISVIVACRNEAANLSTLIVSLAAQDYPFEKFEVILVDDHSTDESYERMKDMIRKQINFRCISLEDGREGKKAALMRGIEAATFEIIATTDADCTHHSRWLSQISRYFQEDDVKMTIGPVRIHEGHSFFARAQAMEFMSLVGATGAAVGWGHPVMCNGANLAFRKETFLEVDGYAGNLQIPSGDDEFLMRKVLARYANGIRFMSFSSTVVSSQPQKTLHDFFNQRVRWAGKWGKHSDKVSLGLAVFVFCVQVSFVGVLFNNVLEIDPSLGVLGVKAFIEGLFLLNISVFLEQRFNILVFFAMQFLYPIYVIAVAVSSRLLPYVWKSRKYK